MIKQAFTLLALLLPALALADTYKLDPAHSSASFTVRHMMVSNVHGQFSGVDGVVSYDPSQPASSTVEATIDARTVDTHDDQRNGHLKSPDFFDVAKYPSITFKSRQFVKAGDKAQILGDLTIHGVTKPVTLDVTSISPPVKDPWGMTRVGVSATTTVNRKDYGLVWNKALDGGGVLVGDDVQITLDVELVKKK